MTQRVDDLNAERIRLHGLQQLKLADLQSLRRRIASLDEDLQKNLDVQRLQRYSGVTAALTPDRCPTCEQALADTLLAQEALSVIMPVSDNIEYIRSQKKCSKIFSLGGKGRERPEGATLCCRPATVGSLHPNPTSSFGVGSARYQPLGCRYRGTHTGRSEIEGPRGAAGRF